MRSTVLPMALACSGFVFGSTSAKSQAPVDAHAPTADKAGLVAGNPQSGERARSEVYQTIIDKAVAAGTPGIQAFVRMDDARWTGVSGVSSVEKNTPMTPTQRIRLASITKMFTYAAVFELVKQGRVRITDRIVTHLPPGALEGIPYADQMTVGQLLDHTSGIHNVNGVDGDDFFEDLLSDPQQDRTRTAAELVSYAKKPEHRPTGRPGEKFSYSSTGYIVLEMMLEHLESKPFAQLYRERIFEPLGMSRAGVEGVDFGADAIVDSYARPEAVMAAGVLAGRKAVRDDGLVNMSAGLKHYNAWARAAGAAAASVQDLAKFMDAILEGRLTVMGDLESARFKPGSTLDWNGGSWGIQASILCEPHRGITVIVLTNASNAGPGSHEIAQQLLATARAQPVDR